VHACVSVDLYMLRCVHLRSCVTRTNLCIVHVYSVCAVSEAELTGSGPLSLTPCLGTGRVFSEAYLQRVDKPRAGLWVPLPFVY
jgi:hypothetical protein